MVLMSVMLSVGLVSFAYVDTEQDQSRVERVDESAFNLTEGVLNAQAFVLSRYWPRTSARPYPTCTQATAAAAYCPQPAAIAANFDSVDYQTGNPTWTTTVRDDDEDSDFYDEATISPRAAYDKNGNDKLWVRAEGTYTVGERAGRSRTVVAQVRVERVPVGQRFPERTIVAGKFATSNNGNKKIVDTKPTATSPHSVTVRCADVTSDSCLKYRRDSPQITPPSAVEGGQYAGEPAIPADVQRALKETAQTNETYYPSGCPPTLTGAVVWVENASSCSFTGNSQFNSPDAPGIVVFASGKLKLAGNTSFFGTIYMLNATNSGEMNVAELIGNTEVFGRVFVDGDGGVQVGSSKNNLIYDDFKDVPKPFTVYGTAGVVQNSWRELDG